MSKVTSIRLGSSSEMWIKSKLGFRETLSGYIHNLIREDMKKTIQGKLYAKIDEVIYDLEERMDEIIEEIANNKEAKEDAKEEMDELREFREDLEDAKMDIIRNELSYEDASELLNDIHNAQNGK